jgi:hypothetical protein
MTPEQNISMALETGLNPAEIAAMVQESGIEWSDLGFRDRMCFVRFAALVAAAEREACAKVAMEFRRGAGNPVCGEVAAAIRQRGAA